MKNTDRILANKWYAYPDYKPDEKGWYSILVEGHGERYDADKWLDGEWNYYINAVKAFRKLPECLNPKTKPKKLPKNTPLDYPEHMPPHSGYFLAQIQGTTKPLWIFWSGGGWGGPDIYIDRSVEKFMIIDMENQEQ